MKQEEQRGGTIRNERPTRVREERASDSETRLCASTSNIAQKTDVTYLQGLTQGIHMKEEAPHNITCADTLSVELTVWLGQRIPPELQCEDEEKGRDTAPTRVTLNNQDESGPNSHTSAGTRTRPE
ncbi:hypothetical protein Forpe1208_v009405 [Fusarium oxysporum f. sp. rapae]|uniref:Uncharacterized protein n=1 Tax=Fusarium oxysporum f. sp. rapae TaxID=485398 RepID=A0A8J5NUX4_FUSOX|nr:hypothetical protein Forpe1208_v009405 [Fusarium oxysporum f. sp. rapae]